MFQFRRFPTHGYLIHHALPEVSSGGFPHSDISGSMLICSSPKLFAAYHVLHRLLMPRHSPCALVRLTNRIPSRERLQASVEFPVSGFSLFLIRIMQAHKEVFSLAEIVNNYPKFLFPYCCLLITCFFIHSLFSFQGASGRSLCHLSFLSAFRLLECSTKPSARISFNIQSMLIPIFTMPVLFLVVGQSGLEPPTSRLSVVCSSQLSYWPVLSGGD